MSALSAPARGPWLLPVMPDGGAPLSLNDALCGALVNALCGALLRNSALPGEAQFTPVPGRETGRDGNETAYDWGLVAPPARIPSLLSFY